MPEETFVSLIQGLLQKYGQLGAVVKLPGHTHAFLLRQDGTSGGDLGSDVGPRTPQDDYYTQLKAGPRADSGMLSPWELAGERNPFRQFVNWLSGRSFMNRPADRTKIGQRFSLKSPPQGQETAEA